MRTGNHSFDELFLHYCTQTHNSLLPSRRQTRAELQGLSLPDTHREARYFQLTFHLQIAIMEFQEDLFCFHFLLKKKKEKGKKKREIMNIQF